MSTVSALGAFAPGAFPPGLSPVGDCSSAGENFSVILENPPDSNQGWTTERKSQVSRMGTAMSRRRMTMQLTGPILLFLGCRGSGVEGAFSVIIITSKKELNCNELKERISKAGLLSVTIYSEKIQTDRKPGSPPLDMPGNTSHKLPRVFSLPYLDCPELIMRYKHWLPDRMN